MTTTRTVTAVAVPCFCLLAVGSLTAQSSLLVGISPEVSWNIVEHTKQVTIGGGSSSSTSEASGPGVAANMFGEVRRALAGGSMEVSFELGLIVPAQRLIRGTIHPTSSGEAHDVWPGRWEFRDRFGAGSVLRAGWRLGSSGSRISAVLGTRAMWSEFATGGTNPETGIAGEDRIRLRRWPAMLGVGLSLDSRWPLDLQVAYSRSLTDWVISLPDLGLDYDYVVTGLIFTARTWITR